MNRAQEQSTAILRKVIGAVVATGVMSFCGVIVETAMNITFPALMSHFGIGTSSVQWMTTLYLLVVASVTPLSQLPSADSAAGPSFCAPTCSSWPDWSSTRRLRSSPLLLLGRAI